MAELIRTAHHCVVYTGVFGCRQMYGVSCVCLWKMTVALFDSALRRGDFDQRRYLGFPRSQWRLDATSARTRCPSPPAPEQIVLPDIRSHGAGGLTPRRIRQAPRVAELRWAASAKRFRARCAERAARQHQQGDMQPVWTRWMARNAMSSGAPRARPPHRSQVSSRRLSRRNV